MKCKSMVCYDAILEKNSENYFWINFFIEFQDQLIFKMLSSSLSTANTKLTTKGHSEVNN